MHGSADPFSVTEVFDNRYRYQASCITEITNFRNQLVLADLREPH